MINPKRYRKIRFKQLSKEHNKKLFSINHSSLDRKIFGENKFISENSKKLKDYLKNKLLENTKNKKISKLESELVYKKNNKKYINLKRFNRYFTKSYLEYCKRSIRYIEISEKILKDIKKHPKLKNSNFLFLDRDATILENIFKTIGKDYGFNKKQFESLLLPKDIQNIIIKKLDVKNNQNLDKKYSELFSKKNHKRNQEIIKQIIKENPKYFSGFIKHIKKQINKFDTKKPITIFDTGAFGTSLMYSKLILETLFPDRKINTAIVYGSKYSQEYIDYTYSRGSDFAISAKNFENYPKPKNSLRSINISKNNKIYTKRENKNLIYDINDYLFESKVFNLALGNMLVYKNKGVDVTNPFFIERYNDFSNKIGHSLI